MIRSFLAPAAILLLAGVCLAAPSPQAPRPPQAPPVVANEPAKTSTDTCDCATTGWCDCGDNCACPACAGYRKTTDEPCCTTQARSRAVATPASTSIAPSYSVPMYSTPVLSGYRQPIYSAPASYGALSAPSYSAPTLPSYSAPSFMQSFAPAMPSYSATGGGLGGATFRAGPSFGTPLSGFSGVPGGPVCGGGSCAGGR